MNMCIIVNSSTLQLTNNKWREERLCVGPIAYRPWCSFLSKNIQAYLCLALRTASLTLDRRVEKFIFYQTADFPSYSGIATFTVLRARDMKFNVPNCVNFATNSKVELLVLQHYHPRKHFWLLKPHVLKLPYCYYLYAAPHYCVKGLNQRTQENTISS